MSHLSGRLWWASLTLSLFLLACSDQNSTVIADDEPACEPGTSYNPITGLCSAPTQDMGSGEDDTTRDQGAPDLSSPDMPSPPQDMTTAVDMPAPPQDMAPPRKDMPPAVEDMPIDMPPMQTTVTRFIALGDTGEGNDAQRRVGQAMGQVCAQYGGCEFALLLGDNAYDSGVDGPADPFFMDIFVTPYSHLPFPFYVVLGNHDLGGDGLGLDPDFSKGDYQVQYGLMNPQWVMPSKFYQISGQHDHVWLLGLNTTEIFFGQDATQRGTVPDWINNAPLGDWKIAFGHHPFISNGKHGNAGEYDSVPDFIPIAHGKNVEDFMNDFICGKVDLYVCGHDHSMQDLQATCGTEFIVTGAGAKTTEIKGSNPAYFNASQVGFTMFEASDTTLDIYFFDDQQNLLHQRTITR